MFSYPANHSRPNRVFNGEGWIEEMSGVGVVWVDPAIQDNEQLVTFGADEDIRIGDLLEIPHYLFQR